MKSYFNRNYPYDLWINSSLWSAAYLAIAFIIHYQADHRELDLVMGVFLMAVIFGTAFSWLIFLLCYFLFHRLPRHGHAQLKRIKPIITGTAITAMLLACLFYGIDFSSSDPEWLIPVCFVLGILTATGTTRLLRQKKTDKL